VHFANARQVPAQWRLDAPRQHRHAVLGALAVAHDNLVSREVDILDPQPDAFHDPQARAVEQTTKQAVRAAESAEHPRHFGARQHHRQAPRRLRQGNTGKPGQLGSEHLPVHEQQRALRLILRGGGDIPRDGQARQKRLDLVGPECRRVPLVVEADEAFNPIDVGLLGADTVVLDADLGANAVEQARRVRRIHRVTVLGSTIGILPIDFRGLSHAMPYGKRMMDAFFSVTIRLYTFR